MSIAILYICTGDYVIFWRDFFISMEKYFIPNIKKEYYVFTDSQELYGEHEYDKIHKYYQEHMGWPYDTLFRFKIFIRAEDEISLSDYIFFFNANYICCEKIEMNELLPNGNNEKLVLGLHPGFYKWRPKYFPYERNKNSRAYIPYNKGRYYFMGGLNGGITTDYLDLIHSLNNNIEDDYKRNIIAFVHDESHLNKYCLDRKDLKILQPMYGYPEDLPLADFECKMLLRDKSKYFDVKLLKKTTKENLLRKLIRKICKFIRCNIMQFIDAFREM